jgi:hypothetical protein
MQNATIANIHNGPTELYPSGEIKTACPGVLMGLR